MADSVMVHKVTLTGGKVVLIRDMQVRDEEIAAQAVQQRAGDNMGTLAIMMQNEIVKNLIMTINDKPVSAIDRESLDKLLSYAEFSQLRKFVGKMMGAGSEDPKSEFVSSSV